MAVLSSDGKYVTVEPGDTLCGIARDFTGSESNFKQLGAINNIENLNLIYVGQKIYLNKEDSPCTTEDTSEETSGSTSEDENLIGGVVSTVPASPHTVVAYVWPTVTGFGLQADSDNTLFATWTWHPPECNVQDPTQGFSVEWDYWTNDKDVYGESIMFKGDHSTVDSDTKYSTYSIPSNAVGIRFRVKALPVTIKYQDPYNNDEEKEIDAFSTEWGYYFYYYTKDLPPKEPSAPTVSVNGFQLTASVSDVDENANFVTFQLLDQNGVEVGRQARIPVANQTASCTFTLSSGRKYRVRAYTWKDWIWSKNWSAYSEEVSTPPLNPSIKSLSALNSNADSIIIQINTVSDATNYDIEYTTNSIYFDHGSETTVVNVDATESGFDGKQIISGLESGVRYFFRVRATNDYGKSGWSPICNIVLGTKPSPPTTWSSTSTCIVGEKLVLYWAHNSTDNSEQTAYAIWIGLNGVSQPLITGTGTTSSYEIDTSKYPTDTKLEWKVITAGITGKYSDPSIQRTVIIYEKPFVNVFIKDDENPYHNVFVIKKYPIIIQVSSGPTSQTPIGYNFQISSKSRYETVDNVGNKKYVNKNEVLFSKYISYNGRELLLQLNPYDVDLQNGNSYSLKCTVAMNSGLSASCSYDFRVKWDEKVPKPNAQVGFNKSNYTALIQPFCEITNMKYFKVEDTIRYDTNKHIYTKTNTEIDYVRKDDYIIYEVIPYRNEIPPLSVKYIKTENRIAYVKLGEVKTNLKTTTSEDVYKGITYDGNNILFCKYYINAKTTTGEKVLFGTTADGEETYYCVSGDSILIPNVELSVYRREYDGTFTLIADKIQNNRTTYVTDPHPSLDYARYRIVSTSTKTGAVSYYDVPGYFVDGQSIIIQWDEDWSNFDTYGDSTVALKPNWTGSLIELPYNISVSNSYSPDKKTVDYIGRENPVCYYGTQMGETSSWSASIPASDKDTLYALRRLARWMGDVYVREPSGIGYWATISVSLSSSYDDLTIPVTLDITRVEGGA